MRMLHTVGPSTASEDEQVIGKGYRQWISPLLIAAPLVTALFADTKWVVAVGFTVVIVFASEAGGRLHDLCIRLRRTNIILSDGGDAAS